MTDEMVNKNAIQRLDGVSGCTDDKLNREKRLRSNHLIQGEIIKFTSGAGWTLRSGETLPLDVELIFVDFLLVVQKWRDGKPIDTIRLQPGEQLPDVNKMNEETPRSEWTQWPDGQPRGPWQAQHICYMLDPRTLRKFSYATGTTGGRFAISDLAEQTERARRQYGRNMLPVIQLSNCNMATRFGGRQRPFFDIRHWYPSPEESPSPALTGGGDAAVEPPVETKAPGEETCGGTGGDEAGMPAQPLGRFAGNSVKRPNRWSMPSRA
jgi:hypothetical protein